jgi:uncharacterized repeat protein (TIGR03837 family)
MMRADLFCRVIDNFGDIGVTWRLARQMAAEHGWSIRLWVDDLARFQQMEPRLATQSAIDGIEIIHWTHDTHLAPSPVAISMFSCALPESYLGLLHNAHTVWINLEYLSAEDWVASCHALASLRSDGLPCYFFFPGFTAQTGGLLREAGLLEKRSAWIDDRPAQLRLLQSLGLSPQALAAWQEQDEQKKACLMTLFCYPNAPINELVQQLTSGDRPAILLLPKGIAPALSTGRQGNLMLERIPFVPQTEYDQILWTADLNFVRGEDSIVRAIWAGKPFVWQIYSQTENTHLVKLDAWLAHSGWSQGVQDLVRSWNPPSDPPATCSNVPALAQQQKAPPSHSAFGAQLQKNISAQSFQAWQSQAARLTDRLSTQTDLCTALDRFIRSKLPL